MAFHDLNIYMVPNGLVIHVQKLPLKENIILANAKINNVINEIFDELGRILTMPKYLKLRGSYSFQIILALFQQKGSWSHTKI